MRTAEALVSFLLLLASCYASPTPAAYRVRGGSSASGDGTGDKDKASGNSGGLPSADAEVAAADRQDDKVVSSQRNSNYNMLETESYPRAEQGLLLGKDRELFHASIDLKRVWTTVVNKETWIDLFKKATKVFSHISGAGDSQAIFREVAIDMLYDIRKNHKDSSIKLFLGSIKQAEAYARRTGRFIVVYIEDNPGKGELRKASEAYRKALSDPFLGKLLNDDFVFFAGTTKHLPTGKIGRLLSANKRADYPLFAVLIPTYIEPAATEKKSILPEKLATLTLTALEVENRKIMRFLQRVQEIHGPTLHARQKEFEELLSAETQLNAAAYKKKY
mgnify:CR=1 FL=1